MKSSSPAASDGTLASSSDGNDVVSTTDNVEINSGAHVYEPGFSASTQLNVTSPETSSTGASKSRKRPFEDDAVDKGTTPDTAPVCSPDGAESGDILPRPSGQVDHTKKSISGTETETEGSLDHPAKKRRTEGQSGNISDQEVGQSNAAVYLGLQNSPNLVMTGTDDQATMLSTSEAVALESEERVVLPETDIPTALRQSIKLAPLPRAVTPQRANKNDSPNIDLPTPSKKPRLERSPTTSSTSTTEIKLATSTGSPVPPDGLDAIIEPASAPKGSPFLTVPLELLSEILILTGSPQHVLAVARTCKALCHTLLSPNAQFVWREARKGPGCTFKVRGIAFGLGLVGIDSTDEVRTQVIRLPDPPSQIFPSEAAYAAFIFDSGACGVFFSVCHERVTLAQPPSVLFQCCNQETNMMYGSFALKARVCKNVSYLAKFYCVLLITYFDLVKMQDTPVGLSIKFRPYSMLILQFFISQRFGYVEPTRSHVPAFKANIAGERVAEFKR